jgi:N-acetylglucosaminyl-diphospho-decaprenol L-rhamnosyltransferase
MVDLSIIIVSYNVRDLLLSCLRSIYEHTGGITFEVIVVDNASTDDSVSSVRERFPQVILMESPVNSGFSHGNNVGMEIAQGRRIILLNSDTEIRGNVFKELLSALDSDSQLGAVGPRLVYPDGRIQHYCARREQNLLNTLRLYYIPYFSGPELFLKTPLKCTGLFETGGLSGAAMMVTREVLKKVGGLDEGFWVYCEDADWSKRISMAGYKLACLTTVDVVHHHGKGLSQIERRRRLEAIKSEIRYFRKYGTFLERSAYRLGVGLNTLLRMLSLDLIRLLSGKPERFLIDWSLLRCVFSHRVSRQDAQTREPMSTT